MIGIELVDPGVYPALLEPGLGGPKIVLSFEHSGMEYNCDSVLSKERTVCV